MSENEILEDIARKVYQGKSVKELLKMFGDEENFPKLIILAKNNTALEYIEKFVKS